MTDRGGAFKVKGALWVKGQGADDRFVALQEQPVVLAATGKARAVQGREAGRRWHCSRGRTEVENAQALCVAKAAREVRVGDRLQVRNEAGDFVIEVIKLSEVRGPAAVAQELYLETEESKQARAKAAEERKVMFASAPAPTRRPTKRDRRLIHKFSGE